MSRSGGSFVSDRTGIINCLENLAAGEPIRMVQLAVLMTFAIALAVTGVVMSKKEHEAADVLEGQLRAASPPAW
ncbi:MAG: hypothetical protein Fues2KO_51560 [Fuerstiella sp.]